MLEPVLPSTTKNSRGARFGGLDALRGIASLLVVLYHYTSQHASVIGPHNAKLWIDFNYPALGVPIFFVISGFVIFMTLERSRRARDFAIARFARLYPAFVACMLLTAACVWTTGFNPRHLGVVDFLVNFILVVGLYGSVYVDPSYWTLTVEVCFYVGLGLFFFLVQHRCVSKEDDFAASLRNPLPYAAIAWVSFAVRERIAHGDSLFTPTALAFDYLYAHLFVVGIALYGFSQKKIMVPGLLLVAAVAAGSMGEGGHFHATAAIKILAFAAVVQFAMMIPVRPLAAAAAAFLGEISYPLYLLHQVIGFAAIRKLEAMDVNANAAVVLVMMGMVVLAYLVHRIVERPAQRLIKRWQARTQVRSTSGVVSASHPAA